MNCKVFEKNLIEYLESTLPEAEHKKAAQHLQSCPACAQLVDKSARLWNGLTQQPNHEVPGGFSFAIQRKIARRKAAGISFREQFSLLQRAFAPVLATGALLAGLWIGNFFGTSLYQDFDFDSAQTVTENTTDYFNFELFNAASDAAVLNNYFDGYQVLEN